MKHELITTADGSTSLYIPELDETYHSTHGAINEALHIFIENGLKRFENASVKIFELGLGTGLNALVSYIYSSEKQTIEYNSIEAYPVGLEVVNKLNYCDLLESDCHTFFTELHEFSWEDKHDMNEHFTFQKIHKLIEDYTPELMYYDLVFFDAFGPKVQSEMWDLNVLEKMYNCLKTGGELITYCAQGQFKRNLKQLGFEVIVLAGPPGKREMTVAKKVAV
jgi:tRNA U34 5-methylaminomethyl-2-thiouridine-forming methyltransferase MnmC